MKKVKEDLCFYFEIGTKDNSKATTLTFKARGMKERVVGWCQGVESGRKRISRKPCFSEAENIKFVVRDEFLKDSWFVCRG